MPGSTFAPSGTSVPNVSRLPVVVMELLVPCRNTFACPPITSMLGTSAAMHAPADPSGTSATSPIVSMRSRFERRVQIVRDQRRASGHDLGADPAAPWTREGAGDLLRAAAGAESQRDRQGQRRHDESGVSELHVGILPEERRERERGKECPFIIYLF